MDQDIYSGSFYGLVRHFEDKRTPFRNVMEVLPDSDMDLRALIDRVVPPAPDLDLDTWHKHDARRKHLILQREFEGKPELHLLHAMLIAILRRRTPPPAAQRLFCGMWATCGSDLAQSLSVRWLISAATTFADCGETPVQRSLGMGLSVMFDMIKIHDTERRQSGRPNSRPFWNRARRPVDDLAFDLEPYAFARGDLDRNMLARLWSLAEEDFTIQPLAFRMLRMVMTDERTIFARLQRYKARRNPSPKPQNGG